MKASELMLGDWVLETEFDRNRPARVEIIEPTRVWLEGGKTYTPMKYIEPIPLTAGILEKNGFEIDKVPMEYYYVHQLQHALWLCGIDKDIEI